MEIYLQVTTRCNMSCKHCCFSCGLKGEDMDVKKALKMIQPFMDRGASLCIGGGEPTLHPHFWDFLTNGAAMLDDEGTIYIATNGSVTETALALLRMNSEAISVELSATPYHEAIDPRVEEAYTRAKRLKLQGEEACAVGRAKKWGVPRCACEHVAFIRPDLKVFTCGCQVQETTLEEVENDVEEKLECPVYGYKVRQALA